MGWWQSYGKLMLTRIKGNTYWPEWFRSPELLYHIPENDNNKLGLFEELLGPFYGFVHAGKNITLIYELTEA